MTTESTPLLRPTWKPGDRRQIIRGEKIPVDAGLYVEDYPGFGTYYSIDGHTYLVNAAKAESEAKAESVDYRHVQNGRHQGAVLNVNYLYR